jgi:hypothetical protein
MGNKQKSDKLNMSFGKASHILRKNIIFMLVQKCNLDVCFRCGGKIEFESLSIDHKIDWLYSQDPKELFFNLDNIAFSHLRCNVGATKNKLRKKIINSKINYKGVYFKNRKSPKKYQAGLSIDGKYKYIGYFLTPIEAAIAYDEFVIKLFGESALTNKSLNLI